MWNTGPDQSNKLEPTTHASEGDRDAGAEGKTGLRRMLRSLRRASAGRKSRPHASFTEAEFKALEDAQEALYEHGNKMDNGPTPPYGSL